MKHYEASYGHKSGPASMSYRMPAEWEKHAATWLSWPISGDFLGKLDTVRWVFCEMIREITRGERVRLIVKDAAARDGVRRQLTEAHIDLDKIDFVLSPTNRSWARDNLPTFVTRKGGKKSEQLAAVKWRFNGWARYANHGRDEMTGLKVAQEFSGRVFLPSWQVKGHSSRRFVCEGGALEVNGSGVLLTTENCLLGSGCPRNAGLGKDGTEAILRETLGVETIVWLPDGVVGDDTSGHVDDFARFVDQKTVVVCAEKNRKDANYKPLLEAKEVLQATRLSRGRKLNVIELPMPEPLFYRGERLPASYANFYIANDSVIVPTFNDPADREALGILSELFPKHRVKGIHAAELVVGLGTLHCSTQQEPLV